MRIVLKVLVVLVRAMDHWRGVPARPARSQGFGGETVAISANVLRLYEEGTVSPSVSSHYVRSVHGGRGINASMA